MIAINDRTGQVFVLRNDRWQEAPTRQNPATGALEYRDGADWKPVRSTGADVGRNLGLGVRAAIEGAAALPGAILDAPDALDRLIGAGLRGLGAPVPQAPQRPTALDMLGRALDASGLPRPQSTSERYMNAAIGGAAGAAATMGAGAALPAASAARSALTGAPVSQLAGGIGSGLAAQHAAELGGDALAQLGAGFAGGALGAGAVPVARGAGAMAPAMLEPFSRSGREAIATDVLLRASDDPRTLLARIQQGLADPMRRLETSVPTTAQAGRDAGLTVLENAIRTSAESGAQGFPTGASAVRGAEAARHRSRFDWLLGEIGPDVPDAARGRIIRDILELNERVAKSKVRTAFESIDPTDSTRFDTAPLASAFRNAVKMFDTQQLGGGVPAPLASIIDQVEQAGGSVPWRALQNLRSQISAIAQAGDDASLPLAQRNRVPAAAQKMLDAIDQVEQEAIRNGTFSPQQAILWQEARKMRREMGETFERDTTGANAMERILRSAAYGRPFLIDEKVAEVALQSASNLNQVLRAAGSARDVVLDHLQREFLSRLWDKARARADVVYGGESIPVLNPGMVDQYMRSNRDVYRRLFDSSQQQRIQRFLNDLAETAATQATGRARGSDTAQNLSVGAAIARVSNGLMDPTGPTAQTLFGGAGLLRLLYAAPEAATREILVQAVVDPKFAALLLARATPTTIARASNYVERNFAERLSTLVQTGLMRAGMRAVTGSELAREELPAQR